MSEWKQRGAVLAITRFQRISRPAVITKHLLFSFSCRVYFCFSFCYQRIRRLLSLGRKSLLRLYLLCYFIFLSVCVFHIISNPLHVFMFSRCPRCATIHQWLMFRRGGWDQCRRSPGRRAALHFYDADGV